ncbi:hypothetical protein QWY85_14030 [Neolewinella lacunae]|uniref:Asl1-like glycosyl hydrolase catalytic domain-containing protein n=1 Tax=Neolewinella lacunae TaxID=1517758 RepID=A0A923T6Y3_9BACT|nr:hypothetical protein [Neolewinella lacunae]MBC6992994.1 hypothetical protein [Neolewinella lacunae]MDN3635784.1 hypothetical protein [Neolewinella lacunae]
MKRHIAYAFFLLPLFTVLCLACSMARQEKDVGDELPRSQVQRQAMRASVWRFVYCVRDDQDPTELRGLLEEIAASQPFGRRIEVVDCATLSQDTLGTGPLAFFGSRIPAGGEGLPLQVDPDWQFDGNKALAEGDVLLLPLYRNPWSGGKTVASFFVAQDLERLQGVIRAEYMENWGRILRGGWSYEIHRANGDQVLGSYVDTTWAFDRSAELHLQSPTEPVYDADGLRIFAYDGAANGQDETRVARAMTRIKAGVDSLLGGEASVYPEVRLYPSVERIGFRLGNMDPVQYDAERHILHLVPSFLCEMALTSGVNAWRPFMAEGERKALNPAAQTDYVAALQYFLRDNFLHAEVWEEAARVGSLQLAVVEDIDVMSPIITDAQARYRAWRRVLGSPGKTKEVLAKLRTGAGDALPLAPAASIAVPPVVPFSAPQPRLAGMTFAHEGYNGHHGYGGSKTKPSLDSLRKLGANAVAVVPYTFQRDPAKAAAFHLPKGAGSENDAGTAMALREAHARDMFTLLKPQIWVGGGNWPGSVELSSAAEWEAWFSNYRYWILHHALMAQREGVTALCLGTELVKTTLKHPEQWRKIIADVRKVYGGQLTYAANWGEEFEGFTFWEDLDAIGLNSYYPLSESEAPSDAELLQGARTWMQMAAAVSRSTDKPLWLTEVGFRSVARAWQNPHAAADDRPTDYQAQERCYRALLTAANETPELRGMFIWKWPSYLGHNEGHGESDTGFVPGGKPAGRLLADFYGEWE